MMTYLVAASGYLALGIVVGGVLGTLLRQGAARGQAMNRSRVVGVVMMFLSLAAVGVSVNATFQASAYARCQSAVTEALIRSQTARAAAAEQDRQSDVKESAATAELIRTVFTVQTAAERVAAYAAYRKALTDINTTRAATERRRRDNPLPAPPSQTCGG